MKKILSILLIAVIILGLTGCGNSNVITCDGEEDEDITVRYYGYYSNNIITKIEVEYIFETKELAKTYCDKFMNEINKLDDSKDIVICKEKSILITNNTILLDRLKMYYTVYDPDKPGLTNHDLTIDEFKDYSEEQQHYKCH